MLRFIIPNDGTRQNRRMKAHSPSEGENKILIPLLYKTGMLTFLRYIQGGRNGISF